MFRIGRFVLILLSSLLLLPVPSSYASQSYLSDPVYKDLTSALFSSAMASKSGLSFTEEVKRSYPDGSDGALYYALLNVEYNVSQDSSAIDVSRGEYSADSKVVSSHALSGYKDGLYFSTFLVSDLGRTATEVDLKVALSRLKKPGAKYVTSPQAVVRSSLANNDPMIMSNNYSSLASGLVNQVIQNTPFNAINTITVVDNADGSKSYTLSGNGISTAVDNGKTDKITVVVGTDNLVKSLVTNTINTDSSGKPTSYDTLSVTFNSYGEQATITLSDEVKSSNSLDIDTLGGMVSLVSHENYCDKALKLLTDATVKDAKTAAALSKDGKVNVTMVQKAIKKNLGALNIDKTAKITLSNTSDGVKAIMVFDKATVTRVIHVSAKSVVTVAKS